MAGDRERPPHADRRAHRLGQDARRVPCGDRWAGARRRGRAARGRDAQSSTSRRSRRSRTTSSATWKRRCAASPRSCTRRASEAPEIRAQVRTGDTPQAERAAMRKSPPHILVTTPESLYLLLTSESGRAMLASTRSVIVDEIHAVAGTKRGSHLALSLERLAALAGPPAAAHRPVRDAEADRGSRARFLTGVNGAADACVDRRQRSRRATAISAWCCRLAARSGDVGRGLADAVRPARDADQRTPHDADLRQHAPHGRARHAAPGRTHRRGATSPRTTAACRGSSASMRNSA